MSTAAINKFVQKFVALIGKKVTVTEEMTALATEFFNSAKKDAKKDAKKEKKEKKEDGAPKKPLNGYMIFSMEVRSLVKQANPEMTAKEITSEIAKQWKEEKEADTETYQKYAKMAEKASEKYKEEKSIFNESCDDQKHAETETEKPEKKKRAPSAYNIFYSIKHEELSASGKNNGEIMKEIGALWKERSAEEKEEYKGKALPEKKKENKTEKKTEKKEKKEYKVIEDEDVVVAPPKKEKKTDKVIEDEDVVVAPPKKEKKKTEKTEKKEDKVIEDEDIVVAPPKKEKKKTEKTEKKEDKVIEDEDVVAPPKKENKEKKEKK
jgi:hypothetical protein